MNHTVKLRPQLQFSSISWGKIGEPKGRAPGVLSIYASAGYRRKNKNESPRSVLAEREHARDCNASVIDASIREA